MSAAIRSLFTTGVAVASVGVIAVSPLAPAPALAVPTVQIPGIELTAAPALGAIPYQILVNLVGDALALAPIVIGGIEQCTVCIGPVSPPSPAPSPFTGWGALGFGVGLLTTPFAIVGALGAGQSVTQALGAGILAFQIPVDNTFALLAVPREPTDLYLGGGYEFAATRDRARQAVTDAIVGTLDVAEQVLTGVRQIISSGLLAITYFAQTLVAGGDVIAAIQAGLAPVQASVRTALNNTVDAVQTLREAVYADLTSGPGAATSPIPTVAAPAAAVPAAATISVPARAAASVAASVVAEAATTTTAADTTARSGRRSGPAPRAAAGPARPAAAQTDTAQTDAAQPDAAQTDDDSRPNRARSAAARSAG